MLQSALRLALFLLSSLGCWEALRRRQLPLYFLPALTIALQFLVLFFAGLWNLLPQAAWGLYLGGLYLFFRFFRQDKLALPRRFLNWGYGLFALGILLSAMAVRGQVFSSYDDFSHWAVIVKSLLTNDRFPNFSDWYIGYQNYPLGSSAWVYFFSRFVGSSESIWMLAQAYMLLAMLLPLFTLVKNRTSLFAPLFLLLANGLLCYNISIYSLMVDSILPLTGTAALLFIWQESLNQSTPRKNSDLLWAAPLLCLAAQIKNSGILYVVLGIALLLFVACRDHRYRQTAFLCALCPLIVLLLWNRHCVYVFPNALDSFHAVSAENFSTVISQKTWSDIQYITQRVLTYIFTRRELIWLLGCILVLILIALVSKRKAYAIKYTSYVLFLYLFYSIGITLMYLFSMSLFEARNLASIDRYMKTIDISIYYITTACALDLLSGCFSSPRKSTAAFAALLLVGIFGWHQYYGSFVTVFSAPNAAYRRQIEALIQENGIPAGESYFICIPQDDSMYSYFVSEYLLDFGLVKTQVIATPDDLADVPDYNFFLNLDAENPAIRTWQNSAYPHHTGEQAFPTFQ